MSNETTNHSNPSEQSEEHSNASQLTVLSTPLVEDAYEGFGTVDPGRMVGSAKLNALASLKRHRSLYYDSEFEYQRGNNFFLRKIWKRDYLNSAQGAHDRSLSDEDTPSTLTPTRLSFGEDRTSTPVSHHHRTRSKGEVKDLPNVQPRTLEYKSSHENR